MDGLTITRRSAQASKAPDNAYAPYRCVIAVLDRSAGLDSLRYRYGRIDLHFDEEIIERARGRSASWRYRMPIVGDEERMARAMDCIVPMSREVSEMMSRLVGRKPVAPADVVALPRPRRSLLMATSGLETAAPSFISGDIPNEGGYICPPSYNWLDSDMEYCVDAAGNISLPDVMVFEDPWPPGGGGGPGDDDCLWDCWPEDEECDDPAGLCFEDGRGGGFPPVPRDPCLGDNPPVYCTVPCSDPRLNAPATQIGLEALFRDSNYSPTTNYQDRLETVGVLMPDAPHQVYRATEYREQTWDEATALLPLSLFPEGSILIHVHPFKPGEEFLTSGDGMLVQYVSAPSKYDIEAINLKNSDGNQIFSGGLILEPDGIIFFDHTGQITDRINRCGY